MRPQLLFVAALLTGCGNAYGYFGQQYADAVQEPAAEAQPVAQRVVWFFEYSMLTGERTHVVSVEGEAMLDGSSSLVMPTTASDAATLLAAAAEQGRVDPSVAAHAAAMRPASQPAPTEGKLATDWQLGAGFVGQALGEATRDQVDAVVNWALASTGAIGPDAPEGSVLYLYLIQTAVRSKSFSGYEWEYSVRATLASGSDAIATSRAVPYFVYTEQPAATPAGFVAAAEIDNSIFDSAPQSSLMYWNLGPLIRSAARELVLAKGLNPG